MNLVQPAIAPVTVYVFLADSCPISQTATLALRNLYDQYAPRGVRFIGVFPAVATTSATVKAFAKTYRVPFPLQLDPNRRLTRQLRPRVTPEVIVLGNDSRTVLYKGRVDDGFAALGQPRPVLRHHELADALNDISAGRAVSVAHTEAVGCFIE
ncbi:MAG TPA: redoxin domain-containing protein [Hymenobacter sp.]